MIYLGAVGGCIGLLGLFLFRGYHHDHNIGEEIVEQKKNDFVQSVHHTLRARDSNPERSLNQQKTNLLTPELHINEISLNLNEQRKKRHDLILPSLNDTYTTAFLLVDQTQKKENYSNSQQLNVPDTLSTGLNRTKSKSGESIVSTVSNVIEDKTDLEDHFQESRVYATLHALCLHSLVNID